MKDSIQKYGKELKRLHTAFLLKEAKIKLNIKRTK